MTYRHRYRVFRTRLEEVRERIKAVSEAKMRGEPAFFPFVNLLQDYIFDIFATDMALVTNRLDQLEEDMNDLIAIAKGNKLFPQEIQEKPLRRWLARRYILYYQDYPNTHNVYAVKMTPLTMSQTREKSQQYYTNRIIEATAMKLSALAGLVKDLGFQIFRYLSKRGHELVNSMNYSGYGSGNRDDSVVIARNDKSFPLVTRKLYDVVFRPHEIKKAYVRMLGMRELYDDVRYPAVYSMIERRTRKGRLLDSNAQPSLKISKQRRRFKEIIALRVLGY